MIHNFLATAPRFTEDLLIKELKSLGAQNVKQVRGGVSFLGDLEIAYRACLWSRIANRLLLPISNFTVENKDDLYRSSLQVPWNKHFSCDQTFAVSCSLSQAAINNSMYGALVVKDAIADFFRKREGRRPSVDTKTPDMRINLYINRTEASINIDFSGNSLHKRGYRTAGETSSAPASDAAPLKENTAAAVLMRAGWPDKSECSPLLDPMCGTGTLVIEGAMMAAGIAPGLDRNFYGFKGWKKHKPQIWRNLVNEAREKSKKGLRNLPPVIGYDADKRAVAEALANVEKAGLRGIVHIERRELADVEPPPVKKTHEHGLIAVNPPYGVRQGEKNELYPLYEKLGKLMHDRFQGWEAAILTETKKMARHVGLRASRVNSIYNGGIRCVIVHFNLDPDNEFRSLFSERKKTENIKSPKVEPANSRTAPTSGAQMFKNRLLKTSKRFGKWARKNDIACYRIYDRDLPDYAVSVDLFEDTWANVQEYAPPAGIDPDKAQKRLSNIMKIVPETLKLKSENVFLKQRKRQRGSWQYPRLDHSGKLYQVSEFGLSFLVNFTDYLDVGLFLDDRLIRKLIHDLADNRRFLNLFCYTGAATVYAAKGKAGFTLSVDKSAQYLSWARKNMALNGYSDYNHKFHKQECLEFLKNHKRKYDLILLGPPAFSNIKGKGYFDLQKNHPEMINRTANLLTNEGILIFSTNYKNFKLNQQAIQGLSVNNQSKQTLPKDFYRTANMHHCWILTRK